MKGKLQKQCSKSVEQAEIYRKEAELWKMKFDAVTNSLSWKITAPLRAPGYLKRALLYCYFKLNENVNSRISNAFLKHNFIASHNKFISERQNFSSLEHKQPALQPRRYKETITVSIVTFNNLSYLNAFMESLLKSYPPSSVNLMIRDNGSIKEELAILENTVDKYRSQFKSVVLNYGDNVGFGMGHHQNIESSNDELVLLTNIDLEFNSSSIRNLVAAANSADSSVACWEARQTPFEHPKFYDPVTRYTYWNSHACVLMDIQKYKEVGGYDPIIFMYGEDVELSFRYRKHGYNLEYVPESTVFHDTYEDASTFKPLMFSGSLFANVYLRLKYGCFFEAVAGIAQLKILKMKEQGERKRLVGEARKKLPLKLLSKTCFRKNDTFIFNAFDYDFRRVGDFYSVKALDDNPLCSIVIRTYKGRDALLNEAVKSVLNQTYTNYEVLICVDGGKDFESSFLDELEKNSKIAVYRLPKKGRAYAGNHGLEKAAGQYVCFLDDDDGFFADHIEQLLCNLQESENCSAAYSLAFEVPTEFKKTEDGVVSGYIEHDVKTNPYFFQDFDRERLSRENYFPIQSVLFERRLFTEVGGFNESFDYLEDWNLWFKFATIADFKYVEKTTSFFRVPYKVEQRVERQKLLDEAYETVQESNFTFFAEHSK